MPTLKILQTELHKTVASLWEDIGIQLDIDDGQLAQVKADNSDSASCLRELDDAEVLAQESEATTIMERFNRCFRKFGERKASRCYQTKIFQVMSITCHALQRI